MTEPSPWVRRFAGLLPAGGRVLDLAAGGGRHTGFLRAAGHAVVAVDRDIAALAASFGHDPHCTIRALDLEDGAPWALGEDYAGIIVTRYLHRPLFPDIIRALAPGGMLIYETFMVGNERLGHPTNPAFLLRKDELFEVFAKSLGILAFEQGRVDEPRPAMIQRMAAIKGEDLTLLP
ncbi:MAG TPA: SAM-dependent methyltransferase [Stellaceae bacterium]|nr:SAM-dependent methyltransferase [Stellaceae bacterium]